ncbi:MAG: acyl-CoA synthetase [Chloroflexi bacterium]|nr:acyl-CoA synthetase [Chloroflexota bacterium]
MTSISVSYPPQLQAELLPKGALPQFVLSHPDMQFPEEVNLADFCLDRNLVGDRAQRIAVYSGERQVTYQDLHKMVNRCGNGLRGLGIEKGDHVVLRIPNCLEFVVCALALHRLGAVVIPTMILQREKFITHVVNTAEAKALICSHDLLDEVELGRSNYETVERFITVGGDRADLEARGYVTYDELIESSSDRLESVKVRRDDLATAFFTSGTTGMPKGCMHLNLTLMGAAVAIKEVVGGTRPDDIATGSPALGFTYGYAHNLLFPLYGGIPTVLIEGRATAERMLETVQKYRATIFNTAPAAFNQMLNIPDAEKKYDLSSVRVTMSGAAPLLPHTVQNWKARFGADILNTMGASETLSPYLSNWRPESKPGSLGHPYPGWEAKIIDDKGDEVPPGTPGRLAIRGIAAIMYWSNPEKEKEAIENGWSLTGDLAYKDEDGCFWHMSRGDDVIKSRGYRISPGEIEDALLEHPAVFESAVIGAPDDIQGERVKAFVVLKERVEPTAQLAEELKQFVRARLAPYMAPGEVEFTTAFPRTETGKIRRIELKQLEQQRYEERKAQGT